MDWVRQCWKGGESARRACLVVDELYAFPLDALTLILGLLGLEDVPIELLLQPLVCVVDDSCSNELTLATPVKMSRMPTNADDVSSCTSLSLQRSTTRKGAVTDGLAGSDSSQARRDSSTVITSLRHEPACAQCVVSSSMLRPSKNASCCNVAEEASSTEACSSLF